MHTSAYFSNNLISMGPTMDVIRIYLNFGEPCDVCLHGTFLNIKVVLIDSVKHTHGIISLHIKSNQGKQVGVQVYVV